MCGAEPVETSSGIQAGKGFAPRAKCWGRLAIRRRESAAWFNQAPIDGGVFIPPPPSPALPGGSSRRIVALLSGIGSVNSNNSNSREGRRRRRRRRRRRGCNRLGEN